VVVRLTSTGADATRFELEHTAPAADVPPGFWEQFGPGATGVGWDGGLLGLALHLSGSGGLTPETSETWAVSDEGKAFHRASATAWGLAHAASGADPEAAARAADNTYAFFTGDETMEDPTGHKRT